MEISVIEGVVRSVGIPVAICIVFLWIVVDLYLWAKNRASQHLDKQTQSLEKVKHCSERTVDILIRVVDKIDKSNEEHHRMTEKLIAIDERSKE